LARGVDKMHIAGDHVPSIRFFMAEQTQRCMTSFSVNDKSKHCSAKNLEVDNIRNRKRDHWAALEPAFRKGLRLAAGVSVPGAAWTPR
jgi:hypothetical protein